MDQSRYQRLKKQAEEVRARRERAQGMLEASMAQLRDQHGCATIEAGEIKLGELRKAAKRASRAFDEAADAFEAAYAEQAQDA